MRFLLKKLWAVSFLMFCIWAGSLAAAATIGDQAPDFRLPTLSGEEVGLEAFKGEVVLLNFWASWCEPCHEELPAFESIHQKYRDRGFQVVGISIDKKKENAQKMVDELHLSFSVLLDPNTVIIRRYLGRSMPTSYLIDRKGQVREVIFGYNKRKLPQLEKSIVGLLDESAQ
jgi:peroxiredoxin